MESADGARALRMQHHTSGTPPQTSQSNTRTQGSARNRSNYIRTSEKCHWCSKVGHFARDCNSRARGLPPNPNGQYARDRSQGRRQFDSHPGQEYAAQSALLARISALESALHHSQRALVAPSFGSSHTARAPPHGAYHNALGGGAQHGSNVPLYVLPNTIPSLAERISEQPFHNSPY
ncbi:hypothetical protein CF319_g8509 [Tilletia indica]|nr:hypothetical protein CF319_g8509 [Tilletia indica]